MSDDRVLSGADLFEQLERQEDAVNEYRNKLSRAMQDCMKTRGAIRKLVTFGEANAAAQASKIPTFLQSDAELRQSGEAGELEIDRRIRRGDGWRDSADC